MNSLKMRWPLPTPSSMGWAELYNIQCDEQLVSKRLIKIRNNINSHGIPVAKLPAGLLDLQAGLLCAVAMLYFFENEAEIPVASEHKPYQETYYHRKLFLVEKGLTPASVHAQFLLDCSMRLVTLFRLLVRENTLMPLAKELMPDAISTHIRIEGLIEALKREDTVTPLTREYSLN